MTIRTKAEALDHIASLEMRVEQLRRDAAAAINDRDAWRAARLSDPEAECLSSCVRAIEGFLEAQREDRNRHRAFFDDSLARSISPDARALPIGRVLLALAGRYGIGLEPTPGPEPAAAPDVHLDRTGPAEYVLRVGS